MKRNKQVYDDIVAAACLFDSGTYQWLLRVKESSKVGEQLYYILGRAAYNGTRQQLVKEEVKL